MVARQSVNAYNYLWMHGASLLANGFTIGVTKQNTNIIAVKYLAKLYLVSYVVGYIAIYRAY